MRRYASSVLVMVPIVLLSIPAGVRSAAGKAVGPPDIAWKDMTYQQKRRT